MNGWKQHAWGLLLDGACLAAGFGAVHETFIIGIQLPLRYWLLIPLMWALALVLMAWASTRLRHDPRWYCWLRFALFQFLPMQQLARWVHRDLFRRGPTLRGDTVFLVVALLVGAAIYAWGLNPRQPVQRRTRTA